MQCLQQRDAERGECRIAPVARPLRSNGYDIDDAARTLAQKDDAVREIDRFVEVVRDEQQRGPVSRPGREKVILQPHARERVERAERFVE